MTLRLLCVATSKSNAPIIAQMQAQAGSDLEIVSHIGGSDAQFKGTSLSRMNRRRGRNGHLMAADQYSGAAQALFRDPGYLHAMEEFIAHLERRNENNDYRPHPLRTIQEYHDYFHILADAVAQQIHASGATHALFFNVPHLGYDTVAYQTAKALGLEIIILTQSLFPGRYFSMRDPAHYGLFEQGAAVPYPIDRTNQQDWFYMKGIGQEQGQTGRISAKALMNMTAYLLTRKPLALLNPRFMNRLLAQMRRIHAGLPEWRDPFARFFHETQLGYFEHLIEYEQGEVDLSGEFVYFPLQLQPEMTTSSLGGEYSDQALAIERLADMLPDGVRILVKENPKQGAYMRGPMFFHRLRRIPAVQFLPASANTHALTAKARFIATITGTVGWEAICQGKPALAFGQAWYRGLPGVKHYHDGLTYEEVANQTWDHAALEAAMGGLLARSHAGIVERHYKVIAEDYDKNRNAEMIAATSLDLLRGACAPSFDDDRRHRAD